MTELDCPLVMAAEAHPAHTWPDPEWPETGGWSRARELRCLGLTDEQAAAVRGTIAYQMAQLGAAARDVWTVFKAEMKRLFP